MIRSPGPGAAHARRGIVVEPLAVALFAFGFSTSFLIPAATLLAASKVSLPSPSGAVRLTLAVDHTGHLTQQLTLRGKPVVEPSSLGILVDGADLGQGAVLGAVARYRTDERFPWRGVHSVGVDRSNGARVAVRHRASGTGYTLEARVFDDAAAFRFLVPGSGRRVPDAASTFRLPKGAVVWVQGPRDHYEGLYSRKALDEVPAGEWAMPPLTFRLPDGRGFGAITEAALSGYAGMALQADGNGGFLERLGHAVPPSYPFTLRYGEDEAKRLAIPAACDGEIVTPWRVVLVGPTLDDLVTSDAIPSLCPPPDPRLFPKGIQTPWLEPGRAVWLYLDGGERTLAGTREFSRLAGELGFEHQVVEGQWRDWSEEQIRELVAYSAARHVRIWLWLHSRDQREPSARRALFARLNALGIAGVKVDFFDHEARETIDLYHDILKDAAASELLVDFHGANKPTGEPRTWPNEMTREAIRGLEYRRTPAWAEHNTTVPFTRFLAGHADYTPLVFGERRKDTSPAHQIATVVVFTSPVMVYGGHPQSLIDSPAAQLIRSIPSVWDETRVLAPSAIGELAVFARRSGERWLLGVLNGPSPRRVRLELRFLARERYTALTARDGGESGEALVVETRELGRAEPLQLELRAGGGFVARLDPR